MKERRKNNMFKSNAVDKIRFGIEIEFTGMSRKKATHVVGEALNESVKYRAVNDHHWDIIEQQRNRTWTINTDESINSEVDSTKNDEVFVPSEFSCEFISPILKYDDIETVEKIVNALKNAGAATNNSTGTHVHIGAEILNVHSISNLVNIVARKEDLLYKALHVYKAREHTYCKKVDKEFLEDLNREKPETMEELKELWFKKYCEDINDPHHDSRYRGLNLHSLFTKGTVEFRWFNTTMEPEKIRKYIQLCMMLVIEAQNQYRSGVLLSSVSAPVVKMAR